MEILKEVAIGFVGGLIGGLVYAAIYAGIKCFSRRKDRRYTGLRTIEELEPRDGIPLREILEARDIHAKAREIQKKYNLEGRE